MLEPVVLFRPEMRLEKELEACRKHFRTYLHRSDVPGGSLVVGRYSVLPFYRDLEYDLQRADSLLINSPADHEFIADVMAWAPMLAGLTPRTWDTVAAVPEGGMFVLKGQTNSRKDLWRTHMFAPTKADAIQVMLRLQEDSLIGTQRIYAREYVPLRQLGRGLNGMPISEEFRVFVCNGKIVDHGFYWSSHVGDVEVPKCGPDMFELVENVVAALLGEGVLPPFVVVDVARTADGRPIMIELNDGQMSGLSEIDPDNFYRELAGILGD